MKCKGKTAWLRRGLAALCCGCAAVVALRVTAFLIVAAASPTAARAGEADEESYAERAQRLENMSTQEKEELQQKRDRFYELSEEEQDRLRELHRELNAAPHADRLRTIMHRYALWLKTISAGERADLLSLPPEERIPKIRELMQQQEAQRFRRLVSRPLPRDDLRIIYDWLDEIVQEREEELLADLSPEFAQRINEEQDEARRRRMLMFALRNRRGETPLIVQSDLDRLVGRLSPAAQKVLEEVRTAEDQGFLIREWVRAAMFARVNAEVSEEELMRFYVEDLTSDERQELENLSRDEMLQELQRKYNYRRFRDEEGRGRLPWPPFGRDGGRRFGGRGRGRGGPGERPPGDRFPGARPPRRGEFGRGRGNDSPDNLPGNAARRDEGSAGEAPKSDAPASSEPMPDEPGLKAPSPNESPPDQQNS